MINVGYNVSFETASRPLNYLETVPLIMTITAFQLNII